MDTLEAYYVKSRGLVRTNARQALHWD